MKSLYLSRTKTNLKMTDKVLAIIPAAGIGERFQSDIPKQYEYLDGQSVIEKSIKPFIESEFISKIIIAVSKSDNFIFNSSSKLLKTKYSDSSLKTHFRKKDSNGRAYRERTINSKSYKYYADEGKLIGSVWNDIKSMEANSPLMQEYTYYPTQKPLSLLSRIISASSNATNSTTAA